MVGGIRWPATLTKSWGREGGVGGIRWPATQTNIALGSATVIQVRGDQVIDPC